MTESLTIYPGNLVANKKEMTFEEICQQFVKSRFAEGDNVEYSGLLPCILSFISDSHEGLNASTEPHDHSHDGPVERLYEYIKTHCKENKLSIWADDYKQIWP